MAYYLILLSSKVDSLAPVHQKGGGAQSFRPELQGREDSNSSASGLIVTEKTKGFVSEAIDGDLMHLILYWDGEGDGNCSVMSAYRLLIGERGGYSFHWTRMWNLHIPPKCVFVALMGRQWNMFFFIVTCYEGAVGMVGVVLPKEAEALAYREALSWLKGQAFDSFLIEIDAL
nr:uncharacterized protein LOC109159818 [Ipomoea batatas]GMC75394.1 uncharacterized protein LOC109159818 [Ipomoea batatas]